MGYSRLEEKNPASAYLACQVAANTPQTHCVLPLSAVGRIELA
jgi:hypothetical protein